MKTLADLKRAMAIGSKWHCYHVLHHCNYGDRELVFKNSVKVGFKIYDGLLKDSGKVSYFYFPKADLVEFHGEEVHVFFPPDPLNNQPRKHILTYTRVA